MSAKATVTVAYRNEVSYEWERAQHLRDFRAGRMSRDELCDADFLLRAAAEHHGVDMHKSCPICEHDLRLTRWVYGDSLGRRAGSARSEQEIADLVAEGLEFTVHAVEVCPACRWNHLLRAATVYALG
ncbi:Uncharacterised protein [Corynebacterium minutissimum]|uniref:DUF5318 domain-containing protein n=1 Tax=Corynebacterium minutissimum TaxID=38301 RepID=A0A2X4RPF2_9CORY|nr:Uncharacterised protein [Corynebacterium minutissimum]VEG04615.1 Uncharacterised protein [Corynebacterium minutissimum]